MSIRGTGSVARIGSVLACVAVLGATTASARDNGGVADFFSQMFGGGQSEPSPGPVWSEDNPYDRPLIVRPHRHKPRLPKVVAVAKGPTGPVSIYEDRTLRRGDAVMTAHGIRIFNGSDTLPYRDSDFVPIADGRLSKDVAKTLVAMDRVPRN